MSKVTVTPWTDDLFDAREAEFAALVLEGVSTMAGTALAMLRKDELITAAAAPPAEPPPPAVPPAVGAAALASWNVWVETELLPGVTDVFNEGAERAYDALLDVFGQDARDVIPPVGNTYADEYLQHAYNRMVGVGENVWKGIRKELQAGLDAGEGIPQLAERLENYAQLSDSRARTVARTEVISSANAGSYLQMLESGLEDVTKEWLATPDEPHRTRLSHQHADDQAVPLTAEFQVEVYAQGALLGTEPMEFPGDPIATAANVINCRCSMSFSFDDEQEEGVLTAAGKFVESEHPRDSKGKFMNKLEIDLLNAKDKKAAYDKLSTTQKAKIGKATKDKAGVTGGKPQTGDGDGPPLGGLDKKTGKKAPAGKPVFLRVKTLFETDYEDGAIVAVRPNTNERVVWDAGTKRMLLQHLGQEGNWKTVQSFTRGALMKEAKDEDGWFTPSVENTTPVETPGIGPLLPELLPGQKPIKLRTQVVYSKSYDDGEIVAVHPADGLEVRWDATAKRMLVQRDGETQESLTRGALMAKYKDAEGWFSPGEAPAAPAPVVDKLNSRALRKARVEEIDKITRAEFDALPQEEQDRILADLDRVAESGDTKTIFAGTGNISGVPADHVAGAKNLKKRFTAPVQAPIDNSPAGRVAKIRAGANPGNAMVGASKGDLEAMAAELGIYVGSAWKIDKMKDAIEAGVLQQRKDAAKAKEDDIGLTSEITPVIDIPDEIEDIPAPVPDITGVELSKNQFNTLAGVDKVGAVHTGTLAPVKGMYTSAYPALEKLGLLERFTADHPNVPGQDADWLRVTDKGHAVLAAGPDGIVLPTAEKAKKLYVEYNGVVHTRTSAKDYKFASVVHFPWDGGKDVVYSWHTSEALASKSTLTSMQKQNGAYVKAVLEVSDKPITPNVVPAANIPETPQEAVPTPADIPAYTAPDGIPDPASLTSTGNVVGSHGATVYKDNSTGKEWLFKPSPPGMGTFMADADIATARLHEMLGLPTPTTGQITIDGRSGSIQEMYAGATEPFGYNFQPQDLSDADRLVIQKEHIFDWLIGNHDGHSRNYVRLPGGELIGIDKGQAFKFFGSDSLDPSFKPNNSMPAANLLMRAYANGESGGAVIHGLDHPEIKKLFKKIDGIFNSDYRELLRPYAENAAKQGMLAKGGPAYLGLSSPAIPANDVEAFLDYAEARKESLKDDFKALYTGLAQKRKAKMAAGATPLEDFPAPVQTPVQSSTADGVPVKLNAAKLQVAKYSHGEIVAVHNGEGERLIWDADKKKYTLQSRTTDGSAWVDFQSFNKSAAVKHFANEFWGKGWTLPTGGKTHADMPVPLPKVAGTPAPKPAVPEAVNPFTKTSFFGPGDDYSGIPEFLYSSFFDTFRSVGEGGVVSPGSAPEKIFARLLQTQQLVKDELQLDVSLLALSRLMDRVAYQRAKAKDPHAVNVRWVEDSVLELVSTTDGTNIAGAMIHGVAAKKAASTTTHDAVKAIPVSKPGKAKLSSAAFEAMSSAEGREFYREIAPTLTAEQIQTVTEYTTNDYSQINANLRGVDRYGYPSPPKESEYIRAGRIQQAMRPIPRHVRLYRGAGSNALGFDPNDYNNPVTLERVQALVGKTFQDPGFTSTSVSKEKSFSYDTFRFTIEAPKGTPGIYVETISENDTELEMLLAAGTKFKIMSVSKVPITGTNQYEIVMRVVA